MKFADPERIRSGPSHPSRPDHPDPPAASAEHHQPLVEDDPEAAELFGGSIDEDDTTEFYKVVNDDADIMANAAALAADEDQEPSMVAMMDVLQALGGEPEVACNFSSLSRGASPGFQASEQSPNDDSNW